MRVFTNSTDVSQSNQSSDENNASSNWIATAPKITLLDICVAACLWSLNHLADCFPKAPPSRTQGHSRLMTGRGWKNDGKNLFPKSPVPGFGLFPTHRTLRISLALLSLHVSS